MSGPAPYVSFTGGTDPRSLQLHRFQPKCDVPFVPTDDAVVAAMLRLGDVTSDDVVYDLGCGDGRIVVAAARLGARAVGVDIDLRRIHEATDRVRNFGLGKRVTLLRESFFDVDLRGATVVMMYLLPGINVKLRPKLLWELRPGARIISNNFEMGDWGPDKTDSIHHRTLYKWIVPAWVQGDWRCVIDAPVKGRRRHMKLRLKRHYQHVSGTACLDRREIPITEGRIRGDELSFTLWHAEHVRPPARFVGKVAGNQIRGFCQCSDGVSHAWGAIRGAAPTDPRQH